MSAPVIGTALARLRLRALRSAAEPGVIATPIIAGDALSRVARAEGRPSVTLVVPSVTAAVFAGIHTAIEVAALVAKRRSLPMRVLTLDAPSRSSAARAARAIATSTGVEQSTVSVQSAWSTTTTAPGDVWITTYYATTLAVERACDRGAVDRDRVIMLVQDHEPSFFAASTEAVVAEAAYSTGFRTLVNSEPLRRYLTDCTEARGAVRERTFRPSVDIDALRQTAATRSRSDGAVRIGFYARPSRPRNAFGLGRAALQTAGERLRGGGIDFSVTTMGERHHPFDVAGRPVRVLGPLGWDDYFAELAQIDVLLSLQLTPHPSHPPLDAVISGGFAVTNELGGSRSALSDRLFAAGTTPDALATALCTAVERVTNAPIHPFDDGFLASLGRPLADAVDHTLEAIR